MLFYAENGTTPNCTSKKSFCSNYYPFSCGRSQANVEACYSYELPALSPGNSYYSQQGGIGNSIAAGTTIETTQVIYVFATTETTPACIDEKSLTDRITPNLVHQQTIKSNFI